MENTTQNTMENTMENTFSVHTVAQGYWDGEYKIHGHIIFDASVMKNSTKLLMQTTNYLNVNTLLELGCNDEIYYDKYVITFTDSYEEFTMDAMQHFNDNPMEITMEEVYAVIDELKRFINIIK